MLKHGVYQWLGVEGFGAYRYDENGFTKSEGGIGNLVTPGFVDIHFHGAFGIDFMSATPSDLVALKSKLKAIGYEKVLLTTVTESAENIKNALSNLVIDDFYFGFHLEGPFISPTYPGAQPEDFIIEIPDAPSDWDTILDDSRLKVITLAPEMPRALALIMRLFKRGVRVSMGHTNATYEEARRGYEFGVRHATHTYNAMRPLHHREAGAVGYCLANPDLKSEIIYDRKHVNLDALKILIARKNLDAVIAVSDSTAATGLPAGTDIDMWGHRCTVGNKEVHLKGTETLAGSAITLADAFINLAKDLDVETAIRACCHNPRMALGLNDEPATLLEWDRDLNLIGIYPVAQS